MMMMMNQQVCRCCLLEHPLISYNIFERDNLRFELMECIPNLSIEPDDGLPDLICDLCWIRLHEAVDFRRRCMESERELRQRLGIYTKSVSTYHSMDYNGGCTTSSSTSSSSSESPTLLDAIEKTDLINEEAVLCGTTTLCELSPLEVTLLNELLLEDSQNSVALNKTNKRVEDPLISELLDRVLNDEALQTETSTEALASSTAQSQDFSDSCVTSTTSTTTATPRQRRVQKHICTECDKKFTRNFQLRLHLISVHNMGDGLQYECNICNKTFASRHSLNYHCKSVHTAERNHACSKCDRRFVLRSQLASHERIHTGDSKPRIHECLKCGKSWPTKSDLRTHMRTHDPTLVRRFQCDQCEKRFFTRGHLASHLLVHSGEKPFACALCEKCYQSVGNLNNHMVRRHADVMLGRTRRTGSGGSSCTGGNNDVTASDPSTLIET